MSRFLSDVRYGARLLIRSKLTTAAAVVSLALGIGGATAMFSVVDTVLLRPLPYAEPDRLVKVWATSKAGTHVALSPADFLDHRSSARLVEGMASELPTSMSLTGDG